MMQHLFLDARPPQSAHPFTAQRLLLLNLAVAIAYAVTGYAGLQIALVDDVVTLFWPPTGIAFAAIWLGGFRLVPGILLGAFAVNLIVLGAPLPAAAVAVGNVLPATVATFALHGMIARADHPGEFWRVFRFILVAALGSTMLSATVGTLVVALSSPITQSLQSTWIIWWMGDAMGVLIVAPPILLWQRLAQGDWQWRVIRDALAFFIIGCAIIAGLWLVREPVWAVELCKLFTLLLSVLAATRFGLPGPAAVTLLMAVGTVVVTTLGVGPFARQNIYDSFALVHSFLFVTSIAGMLLASALTDLRRVARAEHAARDEAEAARAEAEAARGEAEAASANRIRLLTMISHDVRTPLAGIIGVLDSLERVPLTHDQHALVGLGQRAGGILTTLVTDILDVARVDSGRIRLEPAPFDPQQSIIDVVELNRPAAQSRHLLIAATGTAALPEHVMGDRARFEQLLGNLVSNAIAYTATGEIIVCAQWDASQQLPLVVEVRDTGPGIDPALVPTLFDAFVLAPRPGNRSTGLGLGLHISRSLAELMNGSIDYRAGEGGGSIFRVGLPLPMTQAPATAAVLPEEPPLDVLLVEDDMIARAVTTALLQSHGHRVATAASANAAVDMAASQVFDVVLMDLQLGQDADVGPDSGLVATRRIRQLAGCNGSPTIIALTSDGRAECRAACRAAGMDGVLLKPFAARAGLARAIAAAQNG